MTDHHQLAKEFLIEAAKPEEGENAHDWAALSAAFSTAHDWAALSAAFSTAHGVLALIDIITGDREEEIQDAERQIIHLEAENSDLKQRVRELADQLDGCNDTLRRHEQAATNEAKQET